MQCKEGEEGVEGDKPLKADGNFFCCLYIHGKRHKRQADWNLIVLWSISTQTFICLGVKLTLIWAMSAPCSPSALADVTNSAAGIDSRGNAAWTALNTTGTLHPSLTQAAEVLKIFLKYFSGRVIRELGTVFEKGTWCSLMGTKAQQTVQGIVCSANVDTVSFVFGNSVLLLSYLNCLERSNSSLYLEYLLEGKENWYIICKAAYIWWLWSVLRQYPSWIKAELLKRSRHQMSTHYLTAFWKHISTQLALRVIANFRY